MAFANAEKSEFWRAAMDFRASWRSLFFTGLVFKLLAVVVLWPVVGLLFRGFLVLSGNTVVSDLDIAKFFLGPWGCLCFLIVGAMWLGIFAAEQASLIAVACARGEQKELRGLSAIQFAASKAAIVFRVTVRVVALVLLASLPFLAMTAAAYYLLLTRHDINYYLKEQPPAFINALMLGGLLGILYAGVVLRLVTNWFLALPIVLFENVPPSQALRVSTQRVHGYRRIILLWIVGWLAATSLLSAMVTGLVGLVGQFAIPNRTDSLYLLLVAAGFVLLLWAVAGMVVNLLSTTSLAVAIYRLYHRISTERDDLSPPRAFAAMDSAEFTLRITRARALLACCLVVAVSALVGVYSLRSVSPNDNVQIMAHRGSSNAAPENTMAAIRRAIADGADWVEIDVQETADGEVVVFHDSDFMKVAGIDLKIWDATVDDLEQIDIGSWFDPKFKDERVPTLADVLKACRDQIGVNIELKYYGHDVQLEKRVAEIVESCGMESQVKVMSLKMHAVRKMKSIRPDWQVGLLLSVAAGNVNKIEADFLAVNAAFASRSLIRDAQKSGKEVYVWTVNDAPTMSVMISRGVDGLLTDEPALARTVLEQRAQMSAAERLLIEVASTLGTPADLGEP